MKQEILFAEIEPYILGWVFLGLAFCVIFLVYYHRFASRHPELLNHKEDKELKRKHHNLIMFFFGGFFLWFVLAFLGASLLMKKLPPLSIIFLLLAMIWMYLKIKKAEI